MEFPYKVEKYGTTFLSVDSPRWANREGTLIACQLHIDSMGVVEYGAASFDDEEHGRLLFDFLLRGGAGEITPYPNETPAEIKAKIAEKRYNIETSGIVFNGIDINTERSSQGLILGAALEAFMDPEYTLNWKTPTGFISLSAPMVLLIAKTIRGHVQACFDREAVLVAAVEAGTYNDSMLHLGWPG